MATITTRAGKGSPLTNTEVDDNFTNLNTDKAELSGATFTGNVGIGASPSSNFAVSDSGGAGFEVIPQTANDRTTLLSYDRNTSTYQTLDLDGSDIHFNISGTEKIRIDSSGNVGIGTSSPEKNLHLAGTNAQYVLLHSTANSNTSGDVSGGLLFMNGDDSIPAGDRITAALKATVEDEFGRQALTFSTSTTNPKTSYAQAVDYTDNTIERLRIDSTGNLLVGTTDTGIYDNTSGGNTGFVYSPNGFLQVARETTTATQSLMNLNKMGSDGNIIEFYKDGSNVGVIGTETGRLTIGSGDTGLRLLGDTDEITPWNTSTNAGRDALIDLGNTNNRFKDLHLSGTGYSDSLLVGTTGATANAKLKVNGAVILNANTIYSKSYSTLNTTGDIVAKATGSSNGSSTTFIFTGQGGSGAPFHIVFSCINAGGQWSATRSEIAASASVDVVASTSGNDVLFTFKSKSGSQGYSPRVRIETIGNSYDSTYLAQ